MTPEDLRGLIENSTNDQGVSITPDVARVSLKNAYDLLMKTYDFKPGDLIERKKGLCNGLMKDQGGLAIYLRKLSVEERADNLRKFERGGQAGAMTNDIVILCIINTGEATEYLSNSSYYQPAGEN